MRNYDLPALEDITKTQYLIFELCYIVKNGQILRSPFKNSWSSFLTSGMESNNPMNPCFIAQIRLLNRIFIYGDMYYDIFH